MTYENKETYDKYSYSLNVFFDNFFFTVKKNEILRKGRLVILISVNTERNSLTFIGRFTFKSIFAITIQLDNQNFNLL